MLVFGDVLTEKNITLSETNIFAPENRWFGDYFHFGALPIFMGELLVLGSVAMVLMFWSNLYRIYYIPMIPTLDAISPSIPNPGTMTLHSMISQRTVGSSWTYAQVVNVHWAGHCNSMCTFDILFHPDDLLNDAKYELV